MSEGNGNVLARRAIYALAAISILGLAAGVVVAYFGSPADAIGPVVAGAVGGIVAIVLRTFDKDA